MTNDDEVAVRQLPGAFDRLTTALHGNARRRRRAGIALVLLLVVAAYGIFDGRHQGHENQKHIDCVIAVLLEADAPKCKGVEAQLRHDGVLPPGGVPQLRKERTERDLAERTSTTTTTPRSAL